MPIGSSRNLLRPQGGEQRHTVTFVELFFDLVFVFGITQISHFLVEHFTPIGALQTAVLLMAVWWVWIYTSWVTNWLDPQQTPVRLMLFVLMLAGLVLTTSAPKAFGPHAVAFACAYVFMQVGRALFTLWSLRHHSPENYLNFQRITVWLAFSGVFWIAGAFANETGRLVFWLIALAIDYSAPAAGFRTPGLGRSATGDWDISAEHMAERCGLFIIIALGESILVTGSAFSKLEWTAPTVAAFAVVFVGSVAMWWIYFNVGAEHGSDRFADADNPGRVARAAYTYVHLVLVAGIVLTAVSDELVLAHPSENADLKAALSTLGGPALFLIGNIAFKRSVMGTRGRSHIVGLGLLALLVPAAPFLRLLWLGVAATAALIMVAILETRSFRRGAANAAPIAETRRGRAAKIEETERPAAVTAPAPASPCLGRRASADTSGRP